MHLTQVRINFSILRLSQLSIFVRKRGVRNTSSDHSNPSSMPEKILQVLNEFIKPKKIPSEIELANSSEQAKISFMMQEVRYQMSKLDESSKKDLPIKLAMNVDLNELEDQAKEVSSIPIEGDFFRDQKAFKLKGPY